MHAHWGGEKALSRGTIEGVHNTTHSRQTLARAAILGAWSEGRDRGGRKEERKKKIKGGGERKGGRE